MSPMHCSGGSNVQTLRYTTNVCAVVFIIRMRGVVSVLLFDLVIVVESYDCPSLVSVLVSH